MNSLMESEKLSNNNNNNYNVYLFLFILFYYFATQNKFNTVVGKSSRSKAYEE